MIHALDFKTKDSGDVLLGKNKAEVILLCDWYMGIVNSHADEDKLSEIKRMEILN